MTNNYLPYSSTLNCALSEDPEAVSTTMVHMPRGGSVLSGISRLTKPEKMKGSNFTHPSLYEKSFFKSKLLFEQKKQTHVNKIAGVSLTLNTEISKAITDTILFLKQAGLCRTNFSYM